MKTRPALMRCCCTLIFVGCINITCLGQVKSADAIRSADQGWLKVFAAKNLEKSVAFLDESGAVLAPNGPIANGREAVSKLFTGFFALPELKISWHVDRADVAHSDDLGYTSGAYEMTFNDPTGKSVSDKGKYVTVWRKQKDGSWKVLLDIFNSDLPPAGAS
jgi:ketosteroid isomerase-like protein